MNLENIWQKLKKEKQMKESAIAQLRKIWILDKAEKNILTKKEYEKTR